ncbi:talin-like isoform X3 [Rhopilema esculentum]|uniref:talin-like isoform X3 n=1 Tax=Rhopilema esculentum TaxID=499914 RepID=UPI0031D7E523
MAPLALKINFIKLNTVKTFQFEPHQTVAEAIKLIVAKVPDAVPQKNEDCGLFFSDEDPKKCQWFEEERPLAFYSLKSGDTLEYKNKHRLLKVKMLDGAVKTVMIDDSHNVGNVLQTICERLGITNMEEFSLFIEEPKEEKEEMGTGTLTRDKTVKSTAMMKKVEEREKKKMDQMKRKLHTDDETNWLVHDRTLREQGVDDSQMVVLRRKYMYEPNVNIKNPVEINLLYVQARDGILDGTHPCTMEEACKFAGLQLQIQYGDFDEGKYKTCYIDLKDFLPREYSKNKQSDKKSKEEHKSLVGLDELNAKYRYIQLCQNLKTYGVTFFLVKEKMRGKNKLVPRLLGVTKESILRVDEKTKEVLKTWPLTTVRRWAASPNSFTLDFGDYLEGYYSVQTSEGEQISQLIAGYIDIILKKRNKTDLSTGDYEEESTMLEDSVLPSRATYLQHQTNKQKMPSSGSVALPAVMRTGGQGAGKYTVGQMQEEQYSTKTGVGAHAHGPPMGTKGQLQGKFTPGQHALMTNLSHGVRAIGNSVDDLSTAQDLPDLGSDPASRRWIENTIEENKQNVISRLGAMSAATAALISNTSGDPDKVNYTAVGASVSTITSNLDDLVKGIKMIAALMDNNDNSKKLIDAAKSLATAFSDLLNSLNPNSEDKTRQDLLNAAGDIGTASSNIMRCFGDPDAADMALQEMLLTLAKAVATATAALVLKAKNVAGSCGDTPAQKKIIDSAKETALSTSQLVACAKVLGPHISSPLCQDEMIESAKLVATSVDGVSGSCAEATGDEELMSGVRQAAQNVTDALNNLLKKVREGSNIKSGGQYDSACDDILNATDRLFNSMGNASEMVKQAKILAQATSQLVNGIKADAEGQEDSDAQKRLLAAAKVLADATAKLVEAAKGAARNPNDANEQEKLKKAAEDLRAATNAAASNALKKKLVLRLENAAKHAVASATQMVAAAKTSGASNRNPSAQQQLEDSCKQVQDQASELIQSIRNSYNNRDSPSAQLGLISSATAFLGPSVKMVANAKAAVPTVGDNAVAMQLSTTAQNTAMALIELKNAAGKAAEACGSLEIDNALETVRNLEKELESIKQTAEDGSLKALPGEDIESCALEVGATSKTVGGSMAQLLTAAAQGNDSYTGIAARDTASALKVLTKAIHGVAASATQPASRQAIIKAAQVVMHESANLIEEAKRALDSPNDKANQQRMAKVAKGVSQALNNVVNCLPGQRDVDEAIEGINRSSAILSESHPKFPESNQGYQEVQDQLNYAGVNLNASASEVIHASRGTAETLAKASEKFSKSYQDFQERGLILAGQLKDRESQDQLVQDLRKTSTASSKLLLAAKSLAADPTGPNSKNLLAAAARGVTDAINGLLNACMTAAPGQKECDSAVRNVQSIANVLDNPVEPVNDATFFNCLDTATAKTQLLTKSMTDIASSLKKEDRDTFKGAVGQASDAVCALTESAAQAAYLVAIADPSSTAGRQGLVDQSQFQQAKDAIASAVEGLVHPKNTQQQVLSAATVIAKHTSGLCNACKVASAKTENPVAKRHFVQAAKDVANNTALLVKFIKAYAGDLSDVNRNQCHEGGKPLLEAVENLVSYASSPEFARVPAKISAEARSAQFPLIMAGKSMVTSSSNYFNTAKLLAANSKDQSTWQLFAQHSKAVADAMKKIVTAIKENAPGQHECDESAASVDQSINRIDAAYLSAISQHLQPSTEGTLKGFEERIMLTCAQLREGVTPAAVAAKSEPEHLGHKVAYIANLISPLAEAAIGFASKLTGGAEKQTEILDKTKTVAESASQLIYAAKESGGNPKAAPQLHSAVDESANNLTEAINDLTRQLEEIAGDTGVVAVLVDSINKAVARVEMYMHYDPSQDNQPKESFVECQDSMVKDLKAIARLSQDMVGRSSSKPEALGGLGQEICKQYNRLADNARKAATATTNEEIAKRLKDSVQGLGQSLTVLVQTAGNIQANPSDPFAKRELSENAKKVAEKVSFVMATLQAGSIGTQECINAASALQGMLGDLETNVMFAQAGTLNPDDDGETFGDHRESILKTAKNLVEDTKNLVVSAQGSQEQLATSTQNVLSSMNKLLENVKFGAIALGSDDMEAQVMLLNAAKDVTSALNDLINSTKNASGKSPNDPSMDALKSSAKTMVTNVSSLLKTVRSVEDEAQRGLRAIESTVDAVKQAVIVLQAEAEPERKATPEELIRSTKGVTLATAKAVAAGNSGKQADIVQAANVGRKACTEMLIICKAAAATAESADIRYAAIIKGRECAQAYCNVLDHVQSIVQHPTQQKKVQLTIHSKKVADTVTDLVKVAEELKGTEWVNPEDPNVIAENELLGAAASIEAAARKLAELKPRQRPKQADESLNFEEQILEAARAITGAASALVKAAASAQRELVASGRVCSPSSDPHDDGQWSQGLVSAARMVAAATGSLCEAANAAVQGNASEEKLIASAKAVANSTAQLLLACRVKADPTSLTQKRLQAAGNQIKRAADNLVKAAQGAAVFTDVEVEVTLSTRLTGGIRQEIEAQEEILRKEKELEDARKRLAHIRKARYRDEPME